MDTLKTLTSGSSLDIDKNIDEILSVLSEIESVPKPKSEEDDGKEEEKKKEEILPREKWSQIFSIAGRKRKLTRDSKCLGIIINNLFGMEKTTTLDLSGMVWITDTVLKRIGDALEDADTLGEITTVNVDMCRGISFECLLDSVLSKADNLKHFSCRFCTQFTGSKIEKMCNYPTLLSSVDFSGLNNLSDLFLARFFYVFPSIKVLKLNYLTNLSNNVFKITSEKLPSLNCLEVSFCNPQLSIE